MSGATALLLPIVSYRGDTLDPPPVTGSSNCHVRDLLASPYKIHETSLLELAGAFQRILNIDTVSRRAHFFSKDFLAIRWLICISLPLDAMVDDLT
jgi:hypothetical protein